MAKFGTFGHRGVDSKKSHEIDAVDNAVSVGFEICIPESLVTSDLNLAKLSDQKGTSTKFGTALYHNAQVLSVYWLNQYKVKEDRETQDSQTIKVDKFLYHLIMPTEDIDFYVVADVFFVQDPSFYVAKVLGSYSSIPKMLSANFKHKGELVAERVFNRDTAPYATISIIESGKTFDRRCSALYYWLQLNDTLPLSQV